MKAVIKCVNSLRGEHTFYLKVFDREYYLFNQKFHKSIEKHFRSETYLDRAVSKKAVNNYLILKTITKLTQAIGAVESESNIVVLKKTDKKLNQCRYSKLKRKKDTLSNRSHDYCA